jgi:hypothetical protein
MNLEARPDSSEATVAHQVAAAASLTDAAASGDITPGEAASLSTLVGNVAKVIETAEIVDRLTKLEEQLAARGGNS